ncbi:MAG TPA: ASCH domain-containing protein [Fibrella sp.]|jgi:hypothetical protein
MKAISLVDNNATNPKPWATLVEAGVKTIETRTWPVPKDYELPFDLLICATASSKTVNEGLAVCVVSVVSCHPMKVSDQSAAQCEIYDGAWAWQTTNLRWLSQKFPVRGYQRVFDVDIPEGVSFRKPTDRELKQLRYDLYKANWIQFREVDAGLMASMEDTMTVKRNPL